MIFHLDSTMLLWVTWAFAIDKQNYPSDSFPIAEAVGFCYANIIPDQEVAPCPGDTAFFFSLPAPS